MWGLHIAYSPTYCIYTLHQHRPAEISLRFTIKDHYQKWSPTVQMLKLSNGFKNRMIVFFYFKYHGKISFVHLYLQRFIISVCMTVRQLVWLQWWLSAVVNRFQTGSCSSVPKIPGAYLTSCKLGYGITSWLLAGEHLLVFPYISSIIVLFCFFIRKMSQHW